MMRVFLTALIAASMAVSVSWAADADLKASVEKTAPPTELREPIKSLLGDEAIRIHDAKGDVCTLWFRKEIPSTATAEQVKNGLTYLEIPVTTVIGAIQLPRNWIDFRKQEIPAGVYTLRLALQPMDGDHMGTAPQRDFCLLCPAAKDEKPEPMGLKEAIELSASGHGSTHPAVLLLFPNARPVDQPKIVGKSNGIFVLNVKRPVLAGSEKTTLGFGFTVAGHRTE